MRWQSSNLFQTTQRMGLISQRALTKTLKYASTSKMAKFVEKLSPAKAAQPAL